MKPVFISYLLENGHSNVMYCDCDLFFFDDYSFIYKEMNSAGLLLTPHWTTPYPAVHEEEFLSLFNYGAYNAGFLCASKKGLPALKWWADVCAYRIEESHCNGLHNDQKYLDALPVFFKDIKILDHKGCNIAFWNQHVCKRMLINNKVLINGEFPIVFIHFTNKYIPELLNGNDALIYPYFLEYEKSFRLSGSSLNEFIPDMPTYKPPQPFIKIKRKLLVRTRIKRWLFKLSQR
ncbi:MAG: hypothetical protein HZA79_03945 [Sphingobacteriales bacterium]|nr:hypothetical protein [Sphingobacteriales bacterium]